MADSFFLCGVNCWLVWVCDLFAGTAWLGGTRLALQAERIEKTNDGSASTNEQFPRTMFIKEMDHEEESSIGGGVADEQFAGDFRTSSGGR